MAATRSSSSPTRRGSAKRCGRRPRRSCAQPPRSPTSGSPRRPPTCSTTSSVLLRSRDVPLAAVLEVLNAVAADSELRLEPTLEEARELAREGNVVPVGERFIDDCETPVSAFLKLRAGEPEGAPWFLLESAEQGQVGRYSFLGFRPRALLRWERRRALRMDRRAASSAARRPRPPRTIPTAPSPPASPRYEPGADPAGLPPFAGGAVGFFGYDLVRTVEPLGEPNPDPLGLPDMALMVCDAMLVFDHLRHELTVLACVFSGGEDASTPPTPRRRDDRRDARAPRRRRPAARPRRAIVEPPEFTSNIEREEFEATVARIVEYVHAGDAFQVVPSQRFSAPSPGRGLLDLPRPARGQPLAVHVLPRVRRLPDRRRLARAAGQGPRRHASRRARSPAPTRAGKSTRRTAASPSACSTTRRSAPST